MTTSTFPKPANSTNDELFKVLSYITAKRDEDLKDFSNLKNIFMSGRKVDKIPTSSTDILENDRIGDFNYDEDYLYVIVKDAGNAEWRRITLNKW